MLVCERTLNRPPEQEESQEDEKADPGEVTGLYPPRSQVGQPARANPTSLSTTFSFLAFWGHVPGSMEYVNLTCHGSAIQA